jgi:hypothetical protein
MTLLLVVVLVMVPIIAFCGRVALSRRGRIGRRDQPPAPSRHSLGVLSGLVRHDSGRPASRQGEPRRRGGYRGLMSRGPDSAPHAVQRMPGQGNTATLVDENGSDTPLGYEPRLVPVTKATSDQPPGLIVTAASSAIHLPQLDVYYVQRNVVALARSLQPAGIDQRAAALTLSAVISSRLGRISDVPEALEDSVESANRVVRSISSRDPEYSNMVTTLDIIVLAFNAKKLSIHFAHIGSSSIWLLRAGESEVQMLSEAHTINGSLLRAVGLSQEVLPQIGQRTVRPGDRIFLISAGSGFSFGPEAMDAVLAYSAEPLHTCAAALANAVRSSGVPENITIVAAEVSNEAIFSA